MSLTNGRAIWSHENLVVNADDLCKIIKSCANIPIRHLRIGTLELSFGLAYPPVQIALENSVHTKPLEQAANTLNIDQAKERIALLDDDREQLMLTDPLAYERMLEGEIGDGGYSP